MATMEEMQKEVAELAKETEELQQQYVSYQKRGATIEAAKRKAQEVIIPAPSPIPAAAPSPTATFQVKQYWIKSTLPLLDMLPGLPYIPGIPILPGFKISETP